MPPFRREGRQFNQQENLEGYKVASVRIHVERAIARLKHFGILNFVEHYLYKYVDDILLVIAFLCNCGKDLIGDTKKETSKSAQKEDTENDSEPVVCDLDVPDVDLDLDSDNLTKNTNEAHDDEIEHIVKKKKLSNGEVVQVLESMDIAEAENVLIQNDDVTVNIVTDENNVAASTSNREIPQVTSRSGRQIKRNRKYLQ